MNNEVYTFLTQVRRTELKIAQKIAKREQLECCLLPGALRYDTAKVQTSASDKMPDVMAEVADLDADIEALKRRAAEQTNEICDAIDILDSEESKTVLMMYYIQRMQVEEIAHAIGYAPSTIYKIRQLSCVSIEKILEHKGKRV